MRRAPLLGVQCLQPLPAGIGVLGCSLPPPQVQVHQPEGGNEAGSALLHPWGRCSWVLLQDASKERLKFR